MKLQWKWLLVYGLTICMVLLTVKLGNQAMTVMVENKPVERKYCIVIDPGHGGEDGGAVSISNFPESGYNLDIAMRLQSLMQLLGYDTKMIRTNDISVYTEGKTLAQKKISDLKERVRIVAETKGAVLLSIHQNHFPDPIYQGAQVFYADSTASELLAKQIQSLLVTSVNPGSRRQIKKSSGVYLMEHVKCPAVLIECGFLSNPQEESRLRDPIYQKKLSVVIASAVSQFLSNT